MGTLLSFGDIAHRVAPPEKSFNIFYLPPETTSETQYMQVLHISAECYPAAKAGGLGDVVGALPKYLNKQGVTTGVIIPKYHRKWYHQQTWQEHYRGAVRVGHETIPFTIEKAAGDPLGFHFFAVNMPGKFDREGIYQPTSGGNYGDDVTRWIAFQGAVLQWISQFDRKPSVLHCHDHHTGFIPYLVKYCPYYQSLADVPTVFTIHNGQYPGAFSWENLYLLPPSDPWKQPLLDWNKTINPLACGIKTCWRLTTVSNQYLEELRHSAAGLESLLSHERHKSQGILNGIDHTVWDPKTDHYIAHHLRGNRITEFKRKNKEKLLERFRFQPDLPVFTFIGRLVKEKGADLLPDLIGSYMRSGLEGNFLVLGTGDPWVHDSLAALRGHYPGRVDVALEYNEGLAHQLYAGSDYLLMPSRVEPCGLNQMYAMRYGTIPVVRATGGLSDTVPDLGEGIHGRGFRFNNFSVDDALGACYRATMMYHRDEKAVQAVRKRIMAVDLSWERSAGEYKKLYESLRPV